MSKWKFCTTPYMEATVGKRNAPGAAVRPRAQSTQSREARRPLAVPPRPTWGQTEGPSGARRVPGLGARGSAPRASLRHRGVLAHAQPLLPSRRSPCFSGLWGVGDRFPRALEPGPAGAGGRQRRRGRWQRRARLREPEQRTQCTRGTQPGDGQLPGGALRLLLGGGSGAGRRGGGRGGGRRGWVRVSGILPLDPPASGLWCYPAAASNTVSSATASGRGWRRSVAEDPSLCPGALSAAQEGQPLPGSWLCRGGTTRGRQQKPTGYCAGAAWESLLLQWCCASLPRLLRLLQHLWWIGKMTLHVRAAPRSPSQGHIHLPLFTSFLTYPGLPGSCLLSQFLTTSLFIVNFFRSTYNCYKILPPDSLIPSVLYFFLVSNLFVHSCAILTSSFLIYH